MKDALLCFSFILHFSHTIGGIIAIFSHEILTYLVASLLWVQQLDYGAEMLLKLIPGDRYTVVILQLVLVNNEDLFIFS